MNLPILLLSLAIFVAPIKAAVPDEVLWTPIIVGIILLCSAAVAVTSLRSGTVERLNATALSLGLYIAWGSISMIWQWLAVNHGRPAYMDTMLRTLAYWLAGFVLITQMQPLLRQRRALYACVLALVASAAVVSYIGLKDYLVHVRIHESSWREFGTSTPDYFAGFLVMTIPVTLALFFAAPPRPRVAGQLAYGLALAVQLLVLPTTGSRFALISLAVSFIVFGIGFAVSLRRGLVLSQEQRLRLIAVAAVMLIAVAVVAKPVLHRLSSSVATEQAHSGQFRVYTWRGALHMAMHNPIWGTGPGTFIYGYQRYALVGYTRIAHNSYLQTADEIGIPGLIFLLAGLGCITWMGIRSIGSQVERAQPSSSAREVAAIELLAQDNDRLLECGLLAGFVAGLVQNVIDSDWAFTFDGVTFWLLAALLLACAVRPAPKPHAENLKWDLAAYTVAKTAFWSAIVGVLMVTWAAAEAQALGAAAQVSSDDLNGPNEALSRYNAAISLNPLRPDYYSRLALTVDPQVNPSSVAYDLRRAADLAPSGVAYRRIATEALNHQRPADALIAARKGLEIEPVFVKLWNIVAQADIALGKIDDARAAYQRVVAIERSPVGQILAVTEVVNLDYIDANLFLGDDALGQRDPARALPYYQQAESTLRQYASEGGTLNLMRMAQVGNHANPSVDRTMRDQYNHAATNTIACVALAHQPTAALTAQRDQTLAAFDGIISAASKKDAGMQ